MAKGKCEFHNGSKDTKELKKLCDVLDVLSEEYYKYDERLICVNCLKNKKIVGRCFGCADKFLRKEDMVVVKWRLYCKECADEIEVDEDEKEGLDSLIEHLNNE